MKGFNLISYFLLLFSFLLITGCSGDGADDGPCAGVTCSGFGSCDDSSGKAYCNCDTGYHQEGLKECVPDDDKCEGVSCEYWESCNRNTGICSVASGFCEKDSDCGNAKCNLETHKCLTVQSCAEVDCGEHGTCKEEMVQDTSGSGTVSRKTVFCECEEGYFQTADKLGCEGDRQTCDGVTCSYHGVCEIKDDAPTCNCEPGYVLTDGPDCVAEGSTDEENDAENDGNEEEADPCAGVTCEEWEQCADGSCELSDGKCVEDTDCETGKVCDKPNHSCIDDPCKDIECGNDGVCSNEGADATCNCPRGFMADGTSCVEDTDPVHWCMLKWPDAANPISGEVGGALLPDGGVVHAHVYAAKGIEPGGTPVAVSAVTAELGVTSVALSYPIVETDYKWIAAAENTACSDCENNYGFKADFPNDEAGSFSYIYRFSINSGKSWTYCDFEGVVKSATIGAGKATIAGACGGETCDESWQVCESDKCVPAEGKCEKDEDCGAGETCNTSNHECESEPAGENKLTILSQPVATASSYEFKVKYHGSAIDFSKSKIYLNGIDSTTAVEADYDTATKTFTIKKTGAAKGKYTYLFKVMSTSGENADYLYVPMWVEDSEFNWKDAFLYQIMTDRFFDGDTSNSAKSGAEAGAEWEGGDFAGVKAKLSYLKDLGVNAVWLSSVIRTTQDAETVDGGSHTMSGYHMYWPTATGYTDDYTMSFTDPVEPHFGTSEELKELVTEAHKLGIRILVDLSANHIHKESPLWTDHQSDNWFHDGSNPTLCEDVNWAADKEKICWFDEFLPDMNYSNSDTLTAVMDHAIWMIQEYNLDGFRLDAVKHMVIDFTTTIRQRVKDEIETTGIPFFMIGETFDGDRGKLAYYVNDNKLDGQFDFPFFFKVEKVFYQKSEGLDSMKTFMEENDYFYTKIWSGSLMSNFLGNHDVPRAMNKITGGPQGKWDFTSQSVTDEWPYKRLMNAHTLLMTSRQIPLIYQGDELGMEGAHDPDNRRVMRFGNDLNSPQKMTLAHIQKLGKFRAKHSALRMGDRETCSVNSSFWLYKMTDGSGDEVIVGINLGDGAASGSCSGVSGTFKNLDGNTVSTSSISVPAHSSVVLGKE